MLTPLQIIEKIDEFTVATEDQSPRKYLGASDIGEPCSRKLFYKFRWVGDAKFEGRMLRLFQRGDDAEVEFRGILRTAGFQVFVPYKDYLDGESDFQFTDCEKHFCGTCDGVGLEPGGEHLLLEFKTYKEETKDRPSPAFRALQKRGVREVSPKHWFQIQTYLGELGLTTALYCAVCKNTSELYFEYVDFDRIQFESVLNKAERIINAVAPPERISDNPKSYNCSYCSFRSICHENQPIPPSLRSCRNCAYASPGPSGSWLCAKDNPFGELCLSYKPVTG